MPWWMAAYVVLFGLLLLGNAGFWIRNRGKFWILIYELVSGSYLIYAVVVFWYPWILRHTTIWSLLPIPAVIAFECYYSIWGNTEDVVPETAEKMSPSELEFAKGFSVLLSAPAYVTAAKLFLDTFL